MRAVRDETLRQEGKGISTQSQGFLGLRSYTQFFQTVHLERQTGRLRDINSWSFKVDRAVSFLCPWESLLTVTLWLMQRVGEKFKQAHSILGVEGGGKVERKEKGGGKGVKPLLSPKTQQQTTTTKQMTAKVGKMSSTALSFPSPISSYLWDPSHI